MLEYVTTTVSANLAAPQVATAIWTPAAGRRIILSNIIFTVTEAAHVKIFIDADLAANRIVDQSFEAGSGYGSPVLPPLKLEVDSVIRLTIDAGSIGITMIGQERDG